METNNNLGEEAVIPPPVKSLIEAADFDDGDDDSSTISSDDDDIAPGSVSFCSSGDQGTLSFGSSGGTLFPNKQKIPSVDRSLSLEISQDRRPDDYIYCPKCNDFFSGALGCERHPAVFFPNHRSHPRGLSATLLSMREIPGTDDGGASQLAVFADQAVEVGSWFGPYEAAAETQSFVARDIRELPYVWEIKNFDGTSRYLLSQSEDSDSNGEHPGSQKKANNWLGDIRYAIHEAEQNLIPVQYKRQLYFMVYKRITRGTELKVYQGAGLPLTKWSPNLEKLKAPSEALNQRKKLKRYPCTYCPAIFTNRKLLRTHRSTDDRHRPADDIRCRSCDYVAPYRKSLRLHVYRNHQENPFKCPFCTSRFVNAGKLATHVNLFHTDRKDKVYRHRCTNCGQKFTASTSLNRHLRNGICMTSFGFVVPRKRPISDEHSVKVPQNMNGPKQPKVTSLSDDSDDELEPERTFDKNGQASLDTLESTSQPLNLNDSNSKPEVHQSTPSSFLDSESKTGIATDKKQQNAPPTGFLCRYCPNVYRHHSARCRHEWKHHPDEKRKDDEMKRKESVLGQPFKCSICGKGFKKHQYLMHHNMRHTGDFAHNCEICGKGYPTASEVRKHKAKSHKS